MDLFFWFLNEISQLSRRQTEIAVSWSALPRLDSSTEQWYLILGLTCSGANSCKYWRRVVHTEKTTIFFCIFPWRLQKLWCPLCAHTATTAVCAQSAKGVFLWFMMWQKYCNSYQNLLECCREHPLSENLEAQILPMSQHFSLLFQINTLWNALRLVMLSIKCEK